LPDERSSTPPSGERKRVSPLLGIIGKAEDHKFGRKKRNWLPCKKGEKNASEKGGKGVRILRQERGGKKGRVKYGREGSVRERGGGGA